LAVGGVCARHRKKAAFKTLSTSPAQLQRAKFKALAEEMGTRGAAASSVLDPEREIIGLNAEVHQVLQRDRRRHKAIAPLPALIRIACRAFRTLKSSCGKIIAAKFRVSSRSFGKQRYLPSS
jgi:hypothetical protein